MRIVGGKHKGRAIVAPSGTFTRPTSDRGRESVFNILAHGVDGVNMSGARVADIFAGTGALGLEALSRGAESCIFIENNNSAIAALKKNISTLGEESASTIITGTAQNAPTPPGGPVDIAFVDAPYERGLSAPALERLVAKVWLKPGSIVIIEVGQNEEFIPIDIFEIIKDKTAGPARHIFLKYAP